jgi:hypothetical protein
VHHDTARISLATVQGSRELPGWFWGALGCFSVLVIGLSILFFVVRPGAAATGPSGSAAATIQGPTGGAPIQVEPIASPPSPALQPLAASKPRQPRGVKIARSPGPTARRTPDAPAAAGDGEKAADPAADDSANEEELLRPRKTDATEEELLRPRKPTAAANRDNRERAAPANDDDSSQEN